MKNISIIGGDLRIVKLVAIVFKTVNSSLFNKSITLVSLNF